MIGIQGDVIFIHQNHLRNEKKPGDLGCERDCTTQLSGD